MSYLVLARRFRPQTFESVVGQEHITKALANAILRGKVPHAFLFCGPRGVGKTTSARVLAKALNCTGRKIPQDLGGLSEQQARQQVEPCGECSNCKEIARSGSVAVWEIDGASNNSVDNVRELIDSLRTLPPPGSDYKIYIIDEVHMLSVAAFNALLKSLEEPPPNTIFVFATTEPHKIPETVISRCQRHDFRRLPNELIVERLREIAVAESLEVEPEVFDLIALKAQGGMRDAQSMFDRLITFSLGKIELKTAQLVFGIVDSSFFFRLGDSVLAQSAADCLSLLDEAWQQSIDLRAFVSDFVAYWRNLLVLSLSAARQDAALEKRLSEMLELRPGEFGRYSSQLQKAVTFDLQRIFDIVEQTSERALKSSFPRYVLEAGLVKIANLPSLKPLPELLEALKSGARSEIKHTVDASSFAIDEKKKRELATGISKREEVYQPSDDSRPETGTKKIAFNPSWQDFISHVASRQEVFLGAVLRRVSPKNFSLGRLLIEAGEFDYSLLTGAELRDSLRSCLLSYSGGNDWEIKVVKHNGVPEPVENSNHRSDEKNIKKTEHRIVPGSMVAIESEAKEKRKILVEKETKEDPLVQEILDTFEGSKIERISVLK